MRVEIVTLFWGARHMDMMFKTMLPSLWRSSNIPAMLKDGAEVVHRIYCPPSDAEFLKLYEEFSEIPVEINTSIMKEDHVYCRHEGLYRCVRDHIQRKTLTVMANCDHVFGQGLWKVVSVTQPGQYVCCGHPRVSFEKGYSELQKFVSEHKSNDGQNQDIVRLCIEQVPHNVVTIGKLRRNPYWWTHRLGDHWETYFAEPPPVCWWSTLDMASVWQQRTVYGPWEAIDHDIPHFCRHRNRLVLITDSRDFFWCEFTSDQVYQNGIGSNHDLDTMFYCHTIPLRWYFNG